MDEGKVPPFVKESSSEKKKEDAEMDLLGQNVFLEKDYLKRAAFVRVGLGQTNLLLQLLGKNTNHYKNANEKFQEIFDFIKNLIEQLSPHFS